jgi:pentapeptide MXKDX repeat protein
MAYSKKRKSKKLRKNKIKSRKKKYQRKSVWMKNNKIGGIGIMGNPTTAFNNFVGGSTVSLLTDSSKYGLIFKLTNLDNDANFPVEYYTLRATSMLNVIKNIILKMSFIMPSGDIILSNHYFKDKSTIIESQFFNELNTQLDIYNKSKTDFEPICPSIVQGLILENQESKEFINNFINNSKCENDQTVRIFKHILRFLNQYPELKIGLVGMEMIENSINVYEIPTRSTSEYAKIMCLYEHYRLFKLGYFHGDFHLANCLFEPNTYYIETRNTPNGMGRVTLIDFGATFKHNIPIQDITLTKLINYLLDNTSPIWHSIDPLLNSHFESYQWVKKYLQHPQQNIFEIIDVKRAVVIEKTKEAFLNAGINTDINSHLTFGGSIENYKTEEIIDTNVMSKDLMSKDLMSKDLMSKDIMSKDLMSKDIMSKDIMSKDIMSKDVMSKDVILLKELPEEVLKKNTLEKIKEIYNDTYFEHVKTELKKMNTTIPELYEKEEIIQQQILSNITNNH